MDEISWLSMGLASSIPLLLGWVYSLLIDRGGLFSISPISSEQNSTLLNKIFITIILLIASFFLSFFLLQFNNTGIEQEGDFDTFLHGVWHGVFVVVTVVIPVVSINGIFNQRSWRNILLSISFWIISLALMGGIVDSLNHWQNVYAQ